MICSLRSITTIHASKGLEFPHVFVVGCEEGVLPHLGARETEAETEEGARAEPATDGRGAAEDARIEEERRLMYVAITRAERSLTLSWCRERSRARLSLPQEPSRFIAEMDLSSGASGSRATVSNETARPAVRAQGSAGRCSDVKMRRNASRPGSPDGLIGWRLNR